MRADSLAADTATLGGIVRNLETSRTNDRSILQDSTKRVVKVARRQGIATGTKRGIVGTLLGLALAVLGLKTLL